jgi:nucleotide-binding universal stress UspA family protein
MSAIPLSGPILCPVDFSPLSADALRLAARIGQSCSRSLIALHAQRFEVPPYLTESQTQQIETELRSSLQNAREALRQFASEAVEGDAPEVRIEQSDPREAILRVAESSGSGLIVMGTHGRAGFQRLTLGSVAEYVVHTSKIPVLTIRSGNSTQPISKIVCAVNDSETSRKALQYAARLAQCWRAHLTVVHVRDGEGPRAIPDLCAWIAHQDRPECEIQEVTRHGDPAEQIIKLTQELSAGLLVIGAEHRLFLDKTAIGATASQLVRHAPCAVLTVSGGQDAVPDHVQEAA